MPQTPEQKKDKKVIGIIMTYNCAPYIARAYDRLAKELFDEIICVDDESTDDTVSVAEKLGIKVFTHPHTGYGGNLLFGLRKAKELGGTSMIEIHGDGQFDPSGTPLAIQKIEEEGCDIVLGNRFHNFFGPLRDGMSPIRYFGNLAFSTFGRVAVGLRPMDLFTGFRAYSRRVVETIDFSNNAQEYSFSFQILAQAKYCGLKFDQVPTRGDYRTSHTSMSLWKGVGAIFLTVRTALLYWLALIHIKRDIFATLTKGAASRKK
jgi:glycosyltransferase involved in cell wall biosynthesis